LLPPTVELPWNAKTTLSNAQGGQHVQQVLEILAFPYATCKGNGYCCCL
jgi:hypothetical protein